ncbi:MAG: hypothetical protein QXG36_08795 [Nitrososphaeria archaeon]
MKWVPGAGWLMKHDGNSFNSGFVIRLKTLMSGINLTKAFAFSSSFRNASMNKPFQLSFVSGTSTDFINRPPAYQAEIIYQTQNPPVGILWMHNAYSGGNVNPIATPDQNIHQGLLYFPAFYKAMYFANSVFGQLSRQDAPQFSNYQEVAFHVHIHTLTPTESTQDLDGIYFSTIGYTNNLSLDYRVVKTSPDQINVYVEDPGVVLIYVDASNNQLPNRVVKIKPRSGFNILYYSIGNYKFTVIESNETRPFLLVKTTNTKPIDTRSLYYINYPAFSSYPPKLFTNGFFIPYFLASTEGGAMNSNTITINPNGATSGYFFTVPRLQQFASFFNSTDFSTSGPYRIGGWALINRISCSSSCTQYHLPGLLTGANYMVNPLNTFIYTNGTEQRSIQVGTNNVVVYFYSNRINEVWSTVLGKTIINPQDIVISQSVMAGDYVVIVSDKYYTPIRDIREEVEITNPIDYYQTVINDQTVHVIVADIGRINLSKSTQHPAQKEVYTLNETYYLEFNNTFHVLEGLVMLVNRSDISRVLNNFCRINGSYVVTPDNYSYAPFLNIPNYPHIPISNCRNQTVLTRIQNELDTKYYGISLSYAPQETYSDRGCYTIENRIGVWFRGTQLANVSLVRFKSYNLPELNSESNWKGFSLYEISNQENLGGCMFYLDNTTKEIIFGKVSGRLFEFLHNTGKTFSVRLLNKTILNSSLIDFLQINSVPYKNIQISAPTYIEVKLKRGNNEYLLVPYSSKQKVVNVSQDFCKYEIQATIWSSLYTIEHFFNNSGSTQSFPFVLFERGNETATNNYTVVQDRIYAIQEEPFRFTLVAVCNDPSEFNIVIFNNTEYPINNIPFDSINPGNYTISVKAGTHIVPVGSYVHMPNRTAQTVVNQQYVLSLEDITVSHPVYQTEIIGRNATHLTILYRYLGKQYVDIVPHNVQIVNVSVTTNAPPFIITPNDSLIVEFNISNPGNFSLTYNFSGQVGTITNSTRLVRTFNLPNQPDKIFFEITINNNLVYSYVIHYLKFKPDLLTFNTPYSNTHYISVEDIRATYPHYPIYVETCNHINCSVFSFFSNNVKANLGTFNHGLEQMGGTISRILFTREPRVIFVNEFEQIVQILSDFPVNVWVNGTFVGKINNYVHTLRGYRPYNVTYTFENFTGFTFTNITRVVEYIPFDPSMLQINYTQVVFYNETPFVSVSYPANEYEIETGYDENNIYIRVKYAGIDIYSTARSYQKVYPLEVYIQGELMIYSPVSPVNSSLTIISNRIIKNLTIYRNGILETIATPNSETYVYTFSSNFGQNNFIITVYDEYNRSITKQFTVAVYRRLPFYLVNVTNNQVRITNLENTQIRYRINPIFDLIFNQSYIFNFSGAPASIFYFDGNNWVYLTTVSHPLYYPEIPPFVAIISDLNISNISFEYSCVIPLTRGKYEIRFVNNTVRINNQTVQFTNINASSPADYAAYTFKNSIGNVVTPVFVLGMVEPKNESQIACYQIPNESVRLCNYNENTLLKKDSFVYIIARDGIYSAYLTDEPGEITVSPLSCNYNFDLPSIFTYRECTLRNNTLTIRLLPDIPGPFTLVFYNNTTNFFNSTVPGVGTYTVSGNFTYIDVYAKINGVQIFVCRVTKDISFPLLKPIQLDDTSRLFNLLLFSLLLLLSFYAGDKLSVALPIVALITTFNLFDISTTAIFVGFLTISYMVGAGFKSPFISNWLRDVWLVRTTFMLSISILSLILLSVFSPQFGTYPALIELRTEHEKILRDMNNLITALTSVDIIASISFAFLFLTSLAAFIFKFIYTSIFIFPILLASIHPILAAIYNVLIVIIFIFFALRVIFYTASILGTPSSTLRGLQ